jgi:flagellar motor switch/type III secretory pathway protein FliN
MATVRPSPPAPPPPPSPVALAAEAARRVAHAPDTRPAGSEQPQVTAGGDADTAQALLPFAPVVSSVGLNTEEEGPVIDGPVARLPVEVDVMVPVREFRVRHLLALEPGELVESQWNYGEDLPLAAGNVQLAWSEFEVLDNQIAVRITRLP